MERFFVPFSLPKGFPDWPGNWFRSWFGIAIAPAKLKFLAISRNLVNRLLFEWYEKDISASFSNNNWNSI